MRTARLLSLLLLACLGLPSRAYAGVPVGPPAPVEEARVVAFEAAQLVVLVDDGERVLLLVDRELRVVEVLDGAAGPRIRETHARVLALTSRTHAQRLSPLAAEPHRAWALCAYEVAYVHGEDPVLGNRASEHYAYGANSPTNFTDPMGTDAGQTVYYQIKKWLEETWFPENSQTPAVAFVGGLQRGACNVGEACEETAEGLATAIAHPVITYDRTVDQIGQTFFLMDEHGVKHVLAGAGEGVAVEFEKDPSKFFASLGVNAAVMAIPIKLPGGGYVVRLVRMTSAGEKAFQLLTTDIKCLSVLDKEIRIFRTGTDPLRDVLGSAESSHPTEYASIMDELDQAGVEIVDRPGCMGYSPEAGGPGRLIFEQPASIGALRHEFRHFLDVREAGFPGLGYYYANPAEFWRLEYRAWMEEVRLARQLREFDVGRKLLREMRKRKLELLPGAEGD